VRLVVPLALLVNLPGCHELFGLDKVGQGGACPIVSIATGRNHTCAADERGAVSCWGLNTSGQALPDGPPYVTTPARVTLPGVAVQVSAGREVSCARMDTGTVYCWGNNELGQLGLGITAPNGPPTEVPLGADRAVDLGVGSRHACIVRELDHGVVCWGDNRFLELGRTDVDTAGMPQLVAGTEGSKQLSVGHRHNCIVDASDRALCWGRGTDYQLGGANTDDATPRQIAALDSVMAVSAGGRTSCAVDMTGILRCWGAAESGQLGTGTFPESSAQLGAPVLTDAVAVEMGSLGGCARRANGGVACWGDTDTGSGFPELALSARAATVSDVTQLSHSYFHACSLGAGEPNCWGWNAAGQLGRGNRSSEPEPTVGNALTSVQSVALGAQMTCAHANNTVYCWGANSYGEAGDGTLRGVLVPLQVSLPITNLRGVATRYHRTCAWGTSQIRCWGSNKYGEVGNNTRNRHQLTPVLVSGITSSVVTVAIGRYHVCAIANGSVLCWGYGTRGQLGNGTNTSSTTPVVALGSANATRLAAGSHHNCLVASDGAVRCWGRNDHGGLGTADTNNRASPQATTPVALPGAASDVGAGASHSCALLVDQSVYCWGENKRGQLAQPRSVLGSNVAVLVALPGPASAIAISEDGGCAQLTSGAAYCWGEGDGDQLGNGSLEDAFEAVEIPKLANMKALARSTSGGCALTFDDRLACWGSRYHLGNGDSSASEPRPPSLTCE
jgi:alpha-tubulin suppressor-like RCC1 family protein